MWFVARSRSAVSPHPALRTVAVVGTGAGVTGSYLPALRAHADRAELVAAVDVDRNRLDGFRELAGDEVAGYSSMDAMLDAVRPDLVLIETPPSLHRERTTAALKAGARVLCEKPLCLSLAEYDDIAAAEEVRPDAPATLEFAAALYKAAFTGQPVLAGEIAPGDPFYPAMHGDHPHWAPKERA